MGGMRRLYAREPKKEEQEVLNKGLRSSSACTVRRSQIILSSGVKRKNTREIAEQYGVGDQCVRDVIRAFEREGVACLKEKSHRRHDNQSGFHEEGLSRLKDLIRQSPRSYGHESSIWTLEMLAQTCWEQKVSTRPVSVDGVRGGLRKLGVNWQRAKHRINSPDPHYAHKKSVETG
jgi:transposase